MRTCSCVLALAIVGCTSASIESSWRAASAPELTSVVAMSPGPEGYRRRAVEDQLGIGARHITISTVGVLPGIVALGERPEQFRLAISIHAPTDELRICGQADGPTADDDHVRRNVHDNSSLLIDHRRSSMTIDN